MADGKQSIPLVAVDAPLNDSKEELKAQGIHEFDTKYGPMQVKVDGPALTTLPRICLTYHDVGLNYQSCWQSFTTFARQSDELFDRFTFVHITAPGQQPGASAISDEHAYLDMEELSSQISLVLDGLGIDRVDLAMGVGAGSYILADFAIKHPYKIKSMVWTGPTMWKCGWIEWYYRLTGGLSRSVGLQKDHWKMWLLDRWFSLYTYRNNRDLIEYYHTELDKTNANNLHKFVTGFQKRKDLLETLDQINCNLLIFVGDHTKLEENANWVWGALGSMDNDFQVSFIKVTRAGILTPAERPVEMINPIKMMLAGMGIM